MPIFMKFDGIDGDVTEPGFEKSIEVMSFSWGCSTNVRNIGGGSSSGKVSFADLAFHKVLDKTSPKLFLGCAQGKHIPMVTLTVLKPERDKLEKYLQYELVDVIISSYQIAGNSGDLPFDAVSISFAKIKFTYYVRNADGSVVPVEATWDQKTNKGG
jgi:type VI secretion system secreted protein Hcp